MRKQYFTTIALFMHFIAPAQFTNRSNVSGLENLIAQKQSVANSTSEIDEAAPFFEFEGLVGKSTGLKQLDELRRKIEKRSAVRLIFLQVESDSTGLTSITVEAVSEGKKYPPSKHRINEAADFGLFVLVYQQQRYFFVGAKSTWPSQLHDLIAIR